MKIRVAVKEVYFVSRVIEAKSFGEAEELAKSAMIDKTLLKPVDSRTQVEDQDRTTIAWMTKE